VYWSVTSCHAAKSLQSFNSVDTVRGYCIEVPMRSTSPNMILLAKSFLAMASTLTHQDFQRSTKHEPRLSPTSPAVSNMPKSQEVVAMFALCQLRNDNIPSRSRGIVRHLLLRWCSSTRRLPTALWAMARDAPGYGVRRPWVLCQCRCALLSAVLGVAGL
jgi:hypothetical protein